jgi:hypothetical protein
MTTQDTPPNLGTWPTLTAVQLRAGDILSRTHLRGDLRTGKATLVWDVAEGTCGRGPFEDGGRVVSTTTMASDIPLSARTGAMAATDVAGQCRVGEQGLTDPAKYYVEVPETDYTHIGPTDAGGPHQPPGAHMTFYAVADLEAAQSALGLADDILFPTANEDERSLGDVHAPGKLIAGMFTPPSCIDALGTCDELKARLAAAFAARIAKIH